MLNVWCIVRTAIKRVGETNSNVPVYATSEANHKLYFFLA